MSSEIAEQIHRLLGALPAGTDLELHEVQIGSEPGTRATVAIIFEASAVPDGIDVSFEAARQIMRKELNLDALETYGLSKSTVH